MTELMGVGGPFRKRWRLDARPAGRKFSRIMIAIRRFLLPALALAMLCAMGGAGPAADGKNGSPSLARAMVLIIRHAEKPDEGDGLTAAGQARANAYVNYFEHYQRAGAPVKLTALFAAANSDTSHRPYLTILPLSQAIGLPINTDYKDKDYAKLADALQSADHGQAILICWHQGKIPDLVRALGADPRDVLPDGNWPDDQYGWVIQLRYDQQGRLKTAKRIVEGF